MFSLRKRGKSIPVGQVKRNSISRGEKAISQGKKALFAVLGISSMVLAGCSAPDTTDSSQNNDSDTVTVVDVLNRSVEVPKDSDRIVLGEGRAIFATSILNKDNPLDKVVAMGDDLRTAAPSYYEKVEEQNPKIKDIPTIGKLAKGDVTVENIASYDPDLFIMTKDHYDALNKIGFIQQLENLNIPYLVTDFRQHPLTNTTITMTALGQVFGQEDIAEEFNKDFEDTVEKVTQQAEGIKDRPSVLYWRAAGLTDCCSTTKDAGLAELITLAGGDNPFEDILPGETGSVTAEQIITSNPDHIIATGGTWGRLPENKEKGDHIEIGYDVPADRTASSSVAVMEKTGFKDLKAAAPGKFHALWHQFYDSPFSFLALEYFATWLHPEQFADFEPEKHWKEIQDKYQPFSSEGNLFYSN